MKPLFLLAGFAALTASAAESPAASRSFRFFTFDSADRAPLVVESVKGTQVVDRPANRLGNPIRITPKSGVISLYTGGEAKPSIGPKDKPVTTFRPIKTSRQLVILPPTWKTNGPLIVNDEPGKIPYNATFLINLTRSAVTVTIGKKSRNVAPGAHNMIPHPEGAADIPVQISEKTDAGDRPIYGSMWVAGSDLRNILLIMPGAEGEPPRVRVIVDRQSKFTDEAPPEKAEKTGKPKAG